MSLDCSKKLLVSELKSILKLEARNIMSFDFQLESNQAFIYLIKSGQVVMMPNSLLDNSHGLLFKDLKCYEECVKKDRYPIENEEKTLEEKYQKVILNIENELNDIISYLDTTYDLKPASKSIEALLITIRSKSLESKMSEKDNLFSELLLGEFIRQSINGKWLLLKKYGSFNPYYTPAILYPNESLLILRDSSGLFFENSSITLENFLKLPFIKHPKLKLKDKTF